jgi:uncharacterized protein (TIGR03437 family)
MLLLNWKTALATALCAAAACFQPGLAQVVPVTILEIDLENRVMYGLDVFDVSKNATDPNVTTSIPTRNFRTYLSIGDIVAVNGGRAKGSHVQRLQTVNMTPTPNPGQAIADAAAGTISDQTFQILKPDGTLIGSIIISGLQGDVAIVGGTGAFLRVRGQSSGGPALTPTRNASVTEDPANRRRNGGGASRSILNLIPMFRPEVVITPSGPAVFHADFSPVMASKPAKAGEVLIVKATGLGPTVPGINPGQPFPTDAILQVNSPVAVTVNGKDAELVNSIGWPGLVDTYRVDFRVPDGATAGTATIQLTAAWIAGAAVNIPTQ